MAALFSCVIRARVIFSDFNADQTRPSAPRSSRTRETRRKSQVGHQCWCRLQQRALRNRFRHLQHQPPLADDGRQTTPSPCFPGQGPELDNWGRLQILWGTKVASCANEGSHVKYAVTGNLTHFMALSAICLHIQRKRSRVTHLSRAMGNQCSG
jgi:hypothetical protein